MSKVLGEEERAAGPYQLVAIFEFNVRFFGDRKEGTAQLSAITSCRVNTVDDSKSITV